MSCVYTHSIETLFKCAHTSQLIWQRLTFLREKIVSSLLVQSVSIYKYTCITFPESRSYQQRFPNQNANHMVNGNDHSEMEKEKRREKEKITPIQQFYNDRLDHRRIFPINTEPVREKIQRWFVKNCCYFSFNWNPVLCAPIN